ncbi:hypothetical protein M0802_015496 [Mischocyttarus mexicanus]|nr:hypothetical protein M0802_015496 [Mischocyttarus mexicanus]
MLSTEHICLAIGLANAVGRETILTQRSEPIRRNAIPQAKKRSHRPRSDFICQEAIQYAERKSDTPKSEPKSREAIL